MLLNGDVSDWFLMISSGQTLWQGVCWGDGCPSLYVLSEPWMLDFIPWLTWLLPDLSEDKFPFPLCGSCDV